jgi:serine/threonine protein kinase
MASDADLTSNRPPEDSSDLLGVGPDGDRRSVHIGRYKLLQKVGEGGFGVVYMAEQTSPVRRRVALKLIKAGMDSKAVLARFDAERQALAMMEHPNIARVLDGGATPLDHPGGGGRPYFVMELVNGIPITQYADENRLTPAQRVELFVPVCRAVQHAHTKGVIHRDLKPGNILVTLHEGHPVPKVIDFGIAKATQGRLTDQTLFTEFRHMMGTPVYMSPEQAEVSGLDVDTRSDVYSLGVMLYELLTGSLPFQREQLLGKGDAEMLRVLREVDPPRPSTRVGSSPVSQTVLQRFRVEPARLGRMLASDLDWVVMKCLEKDRTRRYETAGGLADDLGRFLRDEGVLATPPSPGYRLRRFLRRYRLQVAVTGIVVTALSVGLVSTALALRDARHQRDLAVIAEREQSRLRIESDSARKLADDQRALAEQQRALAQDSARRARSVTRFLTDMLQNADPQKTGRTDVTVAEAVDAAEKLIERGDLRDQPLLESDLRIALVRVLAGLSRQQDAFVHARRALEIRLGLLGPDHPATAEARAAFADRLGVFKQWAAAVEQHRLAVAGFRAAGDDVALHESLYSLAWALGRGVSAEAFGPEATAEAAKIWAEVAIVQARLKSAVAEGAKFADSPDSIRWTLLEAQSLASMSAKDYHEAVKVLTRLVEELESAAARPMPERVAGDPYGIVARLYSATANLALALDELDSPAAAAAQDRRIEVMRKYSDAKVGFTKVAFEVATSHRYRGRNPQATAAMRIYCEELGRRYAAAKDKTSMPGLALVRWRIGDSAGAQAVLRQVLADNAATWAEASRQATVVLCLLRLAEGDSTGAAELARTLASRRSAFDPLRSAELAARTLVANPSPSSADLDLARQCLSELPPEDGDVSVWRRLHTRMLLDLRAGDHAAAIAASEKLVGEIGLSFEPRTMAFACRALACLAAGDSDGARAAAVEAENQARGDMDEYRRLHPETPMSDWLMTEILLREMREKLKQ